MGKLVKVAMVGEIAPGQVKVVQVGPERVALCNVEGEYYAIADLCTHDNGPLGEGELDGYAIECPRHGARFNVRTGKSLCLPAVIPVATYRIKVEGPDLMVELND